jgi:hypothetical protein
VIDYHCPGFEISMASFMSMLGVRIAGANPRWPSIPLRSRYNFPWEDLYVYFVAPRLLSLYSSRCVSRECFTHIGTASFRCGSVLEFAKACWVDEAVSLGGWGWGWG